MDIKQNQKNAIIANSFNQIITYTMTGDIMSLFMADIMRFAIKEITFVISLIQLFSLVRLPLLIFAAGKQKIALIKASVILKALCVGFLLLYPWNAMQYPMYVALIILYQFAVEFGVGICWQPLMREITTLEDRGAFFSKMRVAFMSLSAVYIILVSVFMGNAISEAQYRSMLLVCLIGLCVQYFGMNRMRVASDSVPTLNIKSALSHIVNNKKMLYPLALDILYLFIGFTLNVVYAKTVLEFSSKSISLYITLAMLSGIAALPFMGKRIDEKKLGNLKLINVLYGVYAALLLMLPHASGGGQFGVIILYALAIMSGWLSAYIYLLMTVMQHSTVSGDDASFLVLNLYQTVVFLFGFVVVNLFGVVLENADRITFQLLGVVRLDLFKIVFIVMIAITAITSTIIAKKIIR